MAVPIKATQCEILIIKQVAKYLKVTERTIYSLAAAKKIPAFKVGGHGDSYKNRLTNGSGANRLILMLANTRRLDA